MGIGDDNMSEDKPFLVDLSSLKLDPHNANVGSQCGEGFIEKSLRDLGAGRSVLLDKDGNVIAGNKTLEKWAQLGHDKIMVIPTDGKTLVAVRRDDGETRDVEIDSNFPWHMPPLRDTTDRFSVWCGRGCRNKCKFCQTGWAYRYSENPDPTHLLQEVRKLQAANADFLYLTNDLMQHSFAELLPATALGSYSVRYLKAKGVLPPTKMVRLGIEGISERLRKYVAKPISLSDLIDVTMWLSDNGKGVKWLLMCGLPTEGADDWVEFRHTVRTLKRRGLHHKITLDFTAFIPEPATPFRAVPLTDDYGEHFADFEVRLLRGRLFSNYIRLGKSQLPVNRVKKAAMTLALNEQQLREGGHTTPNDRVLYPFRDHLRKCDAKWAALRREKLEVSKHGV